MNRKRVASHPSPYPPEDVAVARSLMSDTAILAGVDPASRVQLLVLVWAIVSKDRAFALGRDPKAPQGPAQLLPFAAVQRRSPPMLVLTHPDPSDPKDAA